MGALSISLKMYEEGAVSFYAREVEGSSKGPLSRSAAFYNPAMRENRDIAVAAVRWGVSERGWGRVADVMAASGVRALRFAAETDVDEVLANDSNPLAVYVMQRNVRLNGLEGRVRISLGDARVLMYGLAAARRRLDFVDVDPYGTPMPYVDSALCSVRSRGVVGLTATDTPNLFAVYPKKLARVYGVFCRGKPPFFRELGVRSLLGAAARVAAGGGRWLRPLLSYASGHYVRAYLEVGLGASRASDMLEESLGWVEYCRKCGSWKIVGGGVGPPEIGRCQLCGEKMSLCGPLWIGPTVDEDFVGRVADRLPGGSGGEAGWLVSRLREEANLPPLYHDLDFLGGRLKVSSPSPGRVVEELRASGYKAARTHFCPKCVKTDAPIEEVIRAVRGPRL